MTSADPPPSWSVVNLVDTAAKAVTVVGGLSLVMGITYNVAFFLYSKPEWLFHLTLVDNVTATLYAFPFALTIVCAVGLVIVLSRLLARVISLLPVHRYIISAVAFGGGVLIVVLFNVLVGAIFGSIGWPILTLVMMLGILQIFSSRLNPTVLVGLHVALLLAFSLVTSAVLAMRAVAHPMTADVDVGDHANSSVLQGSLVRILDAGFIVDQDNRWIWIPRERVRLVKERRATKVERHPSETPQTSGNRGSVEKPEKR